MEITYERVHELFKYSHGEFIRIKTIGHVKKGITAGSLSSDGYKYIGIDNKGYSVHRLVWLYHNGYMPEFQIDHINRDRADNRIENLREVSRSCNLRNCGNFKNNTSGVKGVSYHGARKSWSATIYNNGKTYYLGHSEDLGEAVLYRLAAEQCLGWDKCDNMTPAKHYAIKNNLIAK